MSVDYVSTAAGTQPQTAASAQLLSAVIAGAVRDMCLRPNAEEKAASRNLDGAVRRAMAWVFEPSPIFLLYAQLVGLNGPRLSEALLSDLPLKSGGAFSDIDRRILQLRHRWWMQECSLHRHVALRAGQEPASLLEPEPEDADDDAA